MTFKFKKATKEQSRLRLALFGPSGSGKTYTALRLATGLGGKVAVVDTERGSASKYADRFEFDVLDLEARNRDIDAYCAAIDAAQSAGYDVLIIDSLTHAWHELLGEVDRLAKSKYRGNTWSAWSEGTPKQRKLVDAILDFDGHVIGTMRTKTEWTTEKDPRTGKSKPIRVGLAPEQGKGIEYEFDLLMELSTEHVGTVSKDRTGKFQDAVIEKPGEDLGKELADWLKTGSVPAPKDANEAIAQAYGDEAGKNYGGRRTPLAGPATVAKPRIPVLGLPEDTDLDYTPEWIDTDTPRLWGKLYFEARKLGYANDSNVKGALAQVYGIDKWNENEQSEQNRSYRESWHLLQEHQRSKVEETA